MNQPNIVILMADDMGYSDLGCYGGEIDTPNLDALGHGGVRLTHFYTTARCSPSRASLLTGLHQHQTGIGVLVGDDRPAGYSGDLSPDVGTLAEMLRSAGYATGMTGKWHLTASLTSPSGSWPTRRGFEYFYGTINGCGSFYDPGTLTRGETNIEQEAHASDFFYTTAITEEAAGFIDSQSERDAPFFLYVAYTAPHFPLHAHPADVGRYAGRFDDGWDVLRAARLECQKQEGIAAPGAELSPRDPETPAWDEVQEKEWQARRMEVYAAQVTELDRGIGRIVDALKRQGVYENTMIVFLSDNGAEATELPHLDLGERQDMVRPVTRDGRPVQYGNDRTVLPGAEDTFASYGRGWANLSNTPYRLYKKWNHEGGIAAPFIVHWPRGDLRSGDLLHTPIQLTSVVPTVLEAVGVRHPEIVDGRPFPAPEGTSFLGALRGEPVSDDDVRLYWEHVGNAAMRRGAWKIVREFGGEWELYDVAADPIEAHDFAATSPDLVEELALEWQRWADRVGVIPFARIVEQYESRGLTAAHAAG